MPASVMATRNGGGARSHHGDYDPGDFDPGFSEGQAAVAGDRHVGAATVPMVGGDAGRHAMPEPGDQPGGLCGVGGRNLFAHKRIHERRLARLEGAGQGDADRLIEPAADPVQFGQGLRPVLVNGV